MGSIEAANSTDGAPAGSSALLEVESLRVQFKNLLAVADVNLSLHAGTLLGLIGPNGAGKTTLLRAIAALQPTTRGMVRVFGQRLEANNSEVMRQIGFTPDTPPVYEELTVRQFLHFIGIGYELSASEISERTEFWIEKVWLTEKADTKIKQLSRGMRQRIGLARTLLPNPSVILLDEPAAGLDPAGRVQFRQLLSSLREQGKALIVSSHILADMDEYCTHIGIMSAGRIVQFGTVQQVSAHGRADDGRCRYTVVFAHPVARIAELIGSIEGVSAVQSDTQRLTLEYFADADRASALLAELIVRRKWPIAAFSANASGLEEAYLRTGIRQVD